MHTYFLLPLKTFIYMKNHGLILQPAFLVISLLLISGCGVSTEDFNDSGYSIQNDETILQERVLETDQVINVISPTTDQVSKTVASFDLTLIAEVDAPVVDGVTTQATLVDIFGTSGRAVVSYNVRGDEYKGAVDVVQVTSSPRISIQVRSGIGFTNSKANAAYMNDNELWLAQATDDQAITQNGSNSVVRLFGVSGFKINDNPVHAGVQGFAANSIHESDGRIYVTSGSNAGLTIFNQNLTETIDFVPIPDARWVDTDDSRIVVLSGGPNTGSGILHVLDKSDRSVLHQHSFSGADTPEAKNTLEIKGDLAVVAAGRSGTHLIDLNTGDLLATIPLPDAGSLGLTTDVVESNAASADEEFIFISNGEAGVYAAEANINLNNYSTGNPVSIELLGYLQFDDLQSVNHVAYRNQTLFVAAGLGGVKGVMLTRR